MRKTQHVRESVAAKPSGAAGTWQLSAQPKIATQSTNQDRAHGVRTKTKQSVVHGSVGEQKKVGWSRDSKQALVHVAERCNVAGTRFSTVQPQMSLQRTNHNQHRKTQGAREVTKPAKQVHVLWSENQERKNTQQFMFKTLPKPPLASQHDVHERCGGNNGVTILHKQWQRRPGLNQPMRPGPIVKDSHAAMDMVTETTTSKEGATGKYRKSQTVVVPRYQPHRNKQGTESRQSTYMPQNKARGIHVTMTPRSSRLVIMSTAHVKPGRRVAIQHGTNDDDYNARRNGLCNQADAAQQQELTYVRVLRKRF